MQVSRVLGTLMVVFQRGWIGDVAQVAKVQCGILLYTSQFQGRVAGISATSSIYHFVMDANFPNHLYKLLCNLQLIVISHNYPAVL